MGDDGATSTPAAIRLHPLTLSTAFLRFYRIYSDGTRCEHEAVASGFFWRFHGRPFLVTNWHNFTGRSPISGSHLGSFTPSNVEISFKCRDPNFQSEEGGKAHFDRKLICPLQDPEDGPHWQEHPTGAMVDCAVLEIPERYLDGLVLTCVNECDLDHEYDLRIGDDCFLIGHPLGLDGPRNTPIWKRGSIATEPNLEYDDKPCFLVDSSTREGLSGAPVIARTMSLDLNAYYAMRYSFAGIYAGREGNDAFGAQLGRVWKAALVQDFEAITVLPHWDGKLTLAADH